MTANVCALLGYTIQQKSTKKNTKITTKLEDMWNDVASYQQILKMGIKT